jgi:hypothetical protein
LKIDLEESLKWRTYFEGTLHLKIIIQSELGGIDELFHSNQLFQLPVDIDSTKFYFINSS